MPPPVIEMSADKATSKSEENAFHDVLGIILAGLTCEASIKTTGVWISIGYRLILESCPKEVDERSREWQRLFAGLQVSSGFKSLFHSQPRRADKIQIIDLEHASLHMSCPIIPLQAPLPRLHISPEDDIYSLTQMMHTGLTHFTGRGLPTIWSCFSALEERPLLTTSFTAVDAAIIRDWAVQLDRWLARFNKPGRTYFIFIKLIMLTNFQDCSHPRVIVGLCFASTSSTGCWCYLSIIQLAGLIYLQHQPLLLNGMNCWFQHERH